MFGFFSSWQFLVGVSIICLSLSTLLQRVLLKEDNSDPVAYSAVFQLIVSGFLAIFAIFHGFHMPDLLRFWPNVVAMMFLYAITNALVFKSLAKIEASEFTVFFATRAIWTIVAAVLFLGEHFSQIQIIGTAFVLVSVLLVSYREKKLSFNKGIVFALIGACTIGIAFANDAFLLRSYDLTSYLVISFFLPALPIFVFYPKSLKHIKHFLNVRILLRMVSFCFLYAIAALTVYGAYQVARNAAELSAISQFATVLTVLLAVVFLKETTYVLRKLIGAILAFIGVVLIGS